MPDSRRNRRQRQLPTHPSTTSQCSGDASDNRFRRSKRLGGSSDFRAVFRDARRSRDRLFTVLFRRTGGRHARLGLAISKKHCAGAAARNRLKRLVRESFRRHQHAMTGQDIVVMNTAAARAAANDEIFRSLEGHWQTVARAAGRQRDRGGNG